jgi:hypothetical protein
MVHKHSRGVLGVVAGKPAFQQAPSRRSLFTGSAPTCPVSFATCKASYSVSSQSTTHCSFGSSSSSPFLTSYEEHVQERLAEADGLGVAPKPKPLSPEQASELTDELKVESSDQDALLELLVHRVPPGVDEAAYAKATWLSAVAKGDETNAVLSQIRAIELPCRAYNLYGNSNNVVERKRMTMRTIQTMVRLLAMTTLGTRMSISA